MIGFYLDDESKPKVKLITKVALACLMEYTRQYFLKPIEDIYSCFVSCIGRRRRKKVK
jgi:hypothetical protein